MKVAVYQGLGCAHEFVEVKKGVPLSKSLPDLDFEHCAVVVNARLADGSYKPKCGDGIVIRVLPQSLAIVGVVLGVIGILAAVGTGIYAGVAAYQQKQELERQQKQLDLMTALMNPAAGSESINAPFLRGASNAVATGKSQPYVMGRAMFTPYLLTEKWYELEGVDGESQFVTQVLECGFGKQVLESLKAEDILLKTFAGAEPTEDASSLIDDSGSNNFSAGGVVEVAQDGNGFASLVAANWRVKSAVVKTEIPRTLDIAAGKKAKLVYTLDPCAKNVRLAITFAQGLAGQATVTPSYSLDGGESWINFYFRHEDLTGYAEAQYDYQYVLQNIEWEAALITYYRGQGYEVDGTESMGWARLAWRLKKRVTGQPVYTVLESNTFSRDTANEVRFEAVREFTFADYQTLESNNQDCIMIMVEQSGQRNTNTRDQAHLLYYESQCFDPDESLEPAGVLSAEEYSKRHSGGNGLEMCPVISEKASSLSTMLALRMKASTANESASNKINIVTQSVARVVVNGEWTAASVKRPTRNPAAIMLEILQSHTHPLSAFTDEELDMDAFAELYKFCVEEEIEFNAVQTQKTMKSKLLEQVCAVCGASLFWNAEGKLSVAWDHAQDTVVANLTPDSIISVEVEKTLSRPVDAMRISYIDETDWTRKTYTVLNNGVSRLNEDSVIRDLSVTGITKGEQIVKYGRYTMACMNIRQNTVRVRVGHEGMFFSPCSRITVLDDSLGDTPQNMLITRVSSNGDGWTLECVDYDARVYDAGEIPLHKPSVVQLAPPSSGLPEIYAKKGEIDELVQSLGEGTAELGSPSAPTISLCEAFRDGITVKCAPLGLGERNLVSKIRWQVAKTPGLPNDSNWTDLPETNGLEMEYRFDRDTDGFPEKANLNGTIKWRFRAKAVNAFNKQSEWSEAAIVSTVRYGTWIPSAPIVAIDENKNGTRIAALFISQRTDVEQYSTILYRVGIKRLGESDADEFYYKPNLSADPYAAESNYKTDEKFDPATPDSSAEAAYEECERSFRQTLPLRGQSTVIWKCVKAKASGGVTEKVKVWYQADLFDRNSNENFSDDTNFKTNQMSWTVGADGSLAGTKTVGGITYTLTCESEAAASPQDTTYQYIVVPYCLETKRVWSNKSAEKVFTASPSDIHDIVDGSITSNKLAQDAVVAEKIAAGTITADKMAVKMLSAITGNMGAITDGALAGNSNNYWALSRGMYNGVYRAKGTFRVGDENNYIEVKAYNRNGVEVTSESNDDLENNTFKLFFKAGTFEVTSQISTFENNFAIYGSGNKTRLFMTSDGLSLQTLAFQQGETEPAEIGKAFWEEHSEKIRTAAKFYADKNGNLIITNSGEEADIGFSLQPPTGMTVYALNSLHVSGGVLVDLNGTDSENLVLSESNIAAVPAMDFLLRQNGSAETECFDGQIPLPSGKDFMVWNKGAFVSAGGDIARLDSEADDVESDSWRLLRYERNGTSEAVCVYNASGALEKTLEVRHPVSGTSEGVTFTLNKDLITSESDILIVSAKDSNNNDVSSGVFLELYSGSSLVKSSDTNEMDFSGLFYSGSFTLRAAYGDTFSIERKFNVVVDDEREVLFASDAEPITLHSKSAELCFANAITDAQRVDFQNAKYHYGMDGLNPSEKYFVLWKSPESRFKTNLRMTLPTEAPTGDDLKPGAVWIE